ncbi:MAG: 2-phospho-L-lactate guanylyltransferase [Alphaproteobacteria bacterium]|nr:2-phospho-L-lactate guanylyltransferase [Alphaproteobacteria bacterium]
MWAVLPAKNFNDAKQRLGGVLDAEERRGLFRTMYEDVLTSLCAVSALEGVLVVTRDETAAALARQHGAEVLIEAENLGQTAAVEAATAWLAGQGAEGMLAVPGDVPLVPVEEIEAVLAAHETSRGMTIVPARDERGSNCIACSPPDLISFHFGNDSFQPHLQAAREAGVEPKVLRLPGIGLDIDRPDDLAALIAEAGESRAQSWLRENGIAERIAVTA